MNGFCLGGDGNGWKRGWPLESGGFARLCENCGSAYESLVFCERFHLKESGWRECNLCNRYIHCGCIVSKTLFKHLDFGGIGCVNCVNVTQYRRDIKTPNVALASTKTYASDRHAAHIDGRLSAGSADEGKLMRFCRIVEASEKSHFPQAQRDGTVSCIGSFREADARFSTVMKPSGSSHSLTFASLEKSRPTWESKNVHDGLALGMSLGNPSQNTVLPSATGIVEGRLEGKASSPFDQGQRSRPTVPKPSKTGLAINAETNNGTSSQARIPRPPAEGRGKNLLLPRYWPRITDQELQQLSGDLNSTVVPLFEKVLSASDAGRIGRLVLPKACAEAYFPHIPNSDGLPLEFQDAKGNEWTLQFRFWPNNNSRMYVLEGVSPCIQAMQLNAGDTVTFSRIDPGGKFVMGFRRASNSIDTQDASVSAQSNGISIKEIASGPTNSDLIESKKDDVEPHFKGNLEHLHSSTGAAGLLQTENCEQMVKNDSLRQPVSVSEKKRTRNIGPKSKRLLIHSEDAMELSFTWQEVQDMLHPPPSVKPNIVTIEDHEFEEYDVPPVLVKRAKFNTCPLRSSYSGPEEEPRLKELENLPKTKKVSKKRKGVEKLEPIKEDEPSGLDALANAAVFGENLVDPVEPSSGATTKHPRHRVGCTCIVCIQPPSGKGKHKPTCTCLACATVRRRFNTLMQRKKNRQSERAGQIQQRNEPADGNGASKDDTSHLDEPNAPGNIDLNCHPIGEDMQEDEVSGHSS
ncbi:hypothetical protein RIF29_17256 [Crotalaria pallida]|uniref:TF-B3 domain-containing protein n=1 Tax=Crotalaria pallida TaxID=3830 RepID=A0AAN9FQ78_CROPI